MKNLINGITIAVFLVVCVPQPIKAGQDADKPQQQGSPAPGQSQAQPSSTVVSSPVSQPTSQPPEAESKTGSPNPNPTPANEPPKITDWLNVLSSLVLLLVIGGQTYIYWKQQQYAGRQWNAMRRGLVQTRKIIRQNEQAVGAMQGQWEAMKASVERTDTIIEKMELQLGEMRVENAGLLETLERDRAKSNPRLRVSKIRMENFEAGESPILITTIANEGFIDATGVELHIGIRLGDGRAFRWINPQTVMIPAHGKESYPIVTGASLSEQDMRGFRTNVPIEVVVGIRFWPGPPEPKEFCYRYCYRYFPWPVGERPEDVGQFFTCDFDSRMNISLVVQPSYLALTSETVNLIETRTKPQPDEGNENGKDNGEKGNPN